MGQTAIWTSAIVRITTFGSGEHESARDDHSNRDSSITGDNRLRYICIQDEDSDVKVSTHTIVLQYIYYCSHLNSRVCFLLIDAMHNLKACTS